MRGKGGFWIGFALLAVLSLALPPAAPAEHTVVELISTGPGPDGGTGSFGVKASPDGKRVLFSTDSALVPADTDNCDEPEFELFRLCYDGYERFAGTTSLLTTGPTDPHTSHDSPLQIASADLTRGFFETFSPLVAEDTNGNQDVYERHAGVTTLVSTGPAGQGPGGSFLTGASEDGSRVFFITTNRLVDEDDDDCLDVYERSAGTTKLISTGIPPGPTFPCAHPQWVGASADGSRVFLHTVGRVTADDTDDELDIYEWSGGEATLVTTGPADGPEGGGPAPEVVISRDGAHVFFRTMEDLVAEDTDGSSFPEDQDLYERFDGTTRLVVPPVPGDSSPRGFLSAVSDDLSHVFFSTSAGLVPEDTNGASDVYERVGGEIRLVTTGPIGSPGDAFVAGAPSEDGTRSGVTPDGRAVVFASNNRFTPEDTDNVQDVYLRANGETRLVSTGPADSGEETPVRSDLVLLTPDGSRVFTTTAAHFVAEDTDDLIDVYEWHEGQTTLVPHGVPTSDHVGVIANKEAIVRDGSRVFIGTNAPLTPDDTDDQNDLYAVDLPNAPPDCSAVAASPATLSPANGRLVRVGLSGATDPDGDAVVIEITAVTQDERTGRSRDAVLSSAGDEVRLRAERDNKDDGRVYRIAFQASDGSGGSCSGTAKVSVPRKKKQAAVDSAPPSYDSFG